MNPNLIEPENRRRFWLRGFSGAAVAAGAAWVTTSGRAADGGRNPFAYDVEKYRRTDPKLVGYERVTRYPSPKPSPRRMALGPGDRVYLAAGKTVTVVDRGGTLVTEMAFSKPVRALAVASDGTVFAGLGNHVEVVDSKGRRLAVWETIKGKPFLTGIAVGDAGVFLADSGNRVVWRHDRSGKLLGRIGDRDPAKEVPGLVLPSPFLDVELGADGLLRVNNPGRHRVELYTVNGTLELFWGRTSMAMDGFCGCCNPVNLSLLPDGSCVTFEKGLPRVKVYEADGTMRCVVAGPENFADTGAADPIADADTSAYGGLDGVVDSQGHVHVLDLLGANVQVFRPKPPAA
jgi:hypothetical protein